MKNKSIVLGIDAGSRQLGVSIFKGEELLFYAIKTIKGTNQSETLAKALRIITELIDEHKVTHIALSKLVFVQQHRAFIKLVYESILAFLKPQGETVIEYCPMKVRKAVCRYARPTKRNTAMVLSEKYPELGRYFRVSKVWQKRYYAQLFNAIAVGLFCTRSLMAGRLTSKGLLLALND